jgi:hypothetical protein
LGFNSRFLVDTRIRWRLDRLELFLDAVNLLDDTDGQFILIPDPGRKFKFGASVEI